MVLPQLEVVGGPLLLHWLCSLFCCGPLVVATLLLLGSWLVLSGTLLVRGGVYLWLDNPSQGEVVTDSHSLEADIM